MVKKIMQIVVLNTCLIYIGQCNAISKSYMPKRLYFLWDFSWNVWAKPRNIFSHFSHSLKFMVSYFFPIYILKKIAHVWDLLTCCTLKTLSKSFTKYQSSCKIQLSDIHWLSYISCFDYEPTNKEVILVHQASQLKIVQ